MMMMQVSETLKFVKVYEIYGFAHLILTIQPKIHSIHTLPKVRVAYRPQSMVKARKGIIIVIMFMLGVAAKFKARKGIWFQKKLGPFANGFQTSLTADKMGEENWQAFRC